MPSRKQAHVYNQDDIDRLKGIALPPRLKCGLCHKNVPLIRFSTKQQTDARSQIRSFGKILKHINCQDCVGRQTVELECSMCGKTKGIDSFARTQRRKTDTAKCFVCIERQLADNAYEEGKYEDLSNAFTPDHSNGHAPEYFSSALSSTASNVDDGWKSVNDGSRRRQELEANGARRKGLVDGGIALSTDFQRALSMSGSASDSLIDTEYAFPAGRNGDGDSSEPRTKSWHTKSIEVLSASSGFDPNAYGRRTTPSVSGSSRSFASSVAERSDTTKIRPNGWAKIRAAPRASIANNISAQEIRDSYANRLREAEQAAQSEDNGEGPSNAGGDEEEEEDLQAESSAMAAERVRKRKRNQEDAIAKIKKGKAAKKVPKKKKKDSDDDSDFEGVMDMYKKAKPLPGQLENCEICNKRFTVTPYSKAGPDGGLLCTPCGKEMAKDAKAEKKASKPVVRKGRRKIESNRLDGMTVCGPKSLQQLCIEKLAQHSEDIDELGEMPEAIMNRISEIFSKKRHMNSTTMKLFLQPDMERVAIHEAAYLETEDYDQIFAVCPYVKSLSLRNCCQFKDSNIDYMNSQAKALQHIQLLGANLVTNDKWAELFIARGSDLKTLKVEWLDAAFDDEAVEALTTFCPNLERLKIERCKKIGADSIDAIARLEHLQHLTLRFYDPITHTKLIHLITSVGHNLQTLCLEHFLDATSEATDDVLSAIHSTCNKLRKFRFTENSECSDAGYVALFTDWANPPLRYVDLNSTRDLDNTNPDGPLDDPIGLADAGFKALISHSGSKIEYLDISSCRHISHETFIHIFNAKTRYPHLREINLSFCPVVDEEVVAGVFVSCPELRKVVTFGCFGVGEVRVPEGVVLIGAPRARERVEQFGGVGWEVEMGGGGGRVVPVVG
ncbi:Stc1 domain containing protein [Pyrenophora tritici-repentis]|nr:Stc1 domain containing protein [Pyrenophora tritici-repentis]